MSTQLTRINVAIESLLIDIESAGYLRVCGGSVVIIWNICKRNVHKCKIRSLADLEIFNGDHRREIFFKDKYKKIKY